MVPLLVLRDRMIGSIQFYTLLLRKPQQQLLLFLIQITTGWLNRFVSVLIANRIPYSPVLLQPMKHSHHMNEWYLLPLRTMIITWMTPLIHIQMIHPHVSLVHHLIQFIFLPLSATTLFFHHFTVPLPVGAFLHWMNNENMLVTLHKMTSTNNHVHTPDVFNCCGSQSIDVFFGGSKQYMLTSNLEGTTSKQHLGHHSHIEFVPGLLLRTEQIRGKGLLIGTEVVNQ